METKATKPTNHLKLRIDDLKTFDPLTENQKKFFDAYKRQDYFIALHGVAGTGKTFSATVTQTTGNGATATLNVTNNTSATIGIGYVVTGGTLPSGTFILNNISLSIIFALLEQLLFLQYGHNVFLEVLNQSNKQLE